MQHLPLWFDVLISALVLIGTAFAVIGSFGLAKLSDFYKRLHGPTKASTLGVGCVLIASMLYFTFGHAGRVASLHELLITLFVFLTAPISAHMMIKAALKLAPDTHPAPPQDAADRQNED